MEPNSISLGFVHTIPSFVKNIHCTVSCTFDFMKNLSHIRLAFISNGTPNKAEKKGAPAQVSKRKNRWKGTRCKNIKMKIIHLSRSVRQLEPLFDNVMHTIMYAQCEGHREMLKNICCYVSSILYEKKRGRSQIYETQAMVPCARIPLENISSRSPHPLRRVPHPISKSIICVCEAEEAHPLATAPPPFPPPPSCCHRALQPPC